MNPTITAASGAFRIGGKIEINRLGFRGDAHYRPRRLGTPRRQSRGAAHLKRLPELGVNFIDTADSYGPDVSENLIREALHPYDGMLVATKAGLTRSGPDRWAPNGRPDYLIGQARKSLANLGVEKIGLWQLHRIDPSVPRDEQFGVVKTLLDEGVIDQAGLSEVSIDDIEAASKVFTVATVRTAIIWSNEPARTSSITAPDMGLASYPGFRSRRGASPNPARCSTL